MRSCTVLVTVLLLVATCGHGGEAEVENMEKRRRFLEQLQRLLPQCKAWNEWLTKSGELPPDFDAMPSEHGLPDPLLKDDNGKRVPITDLKDWDARRQQLKALFRQWVLGTVPPRPDNLDAKVKQAVEQARLVGGGD